MAFNQKINTLQYGSTTSKPFQPADIITQVSYNRNEQQSTKNNNSSSLITTICKCLTPKFKLRTCLPEANNKLYEYLIGPKHEKNQGKKTLILDLDETLVHSTFDKIEKPDIVVPLRIQNIEYRINVIKRPGVEDFLIKMAEIYEIIVFTASLSSYATPLLDELDSTNVIAYRLFREHCTRYNGIYVKDLSKLGRDLKDTIIVDNSANSFMFHPQNAYHIKNFFFDKSDTELERITPFFEFLADTLDVRPVDEWNKKFFNDKSFQYYDIFNQEKFYTKSKYRTNSRLNRCDSTSSGSSNTALNQFPDIETKSSIDQLTLPNSKQYTQDLKLSKINLGKGISNASSCNNNSLSNPSRTPDEFICHYPQDVTINIANAETNLTKEPKDSYAEEVALVSPKESDSLLFKRNQKSLIISGISNKLATENTAYSTPYAKDCTNLEILSKHSRSRLPNLAKKLEIQTNESIDTPNHETSLTSSNKKLNKGLDENPASVTSNTEIYRDYDLANIDKEDNKMNDSIRLNLYVNSPIVRTAKRKSFVLPGANQSHLRSGMTKSIQLL